MEISPFDTSLMLSISSTNANYGVNGCRSDYNILCRRLSNNGPEGYAATFTLKSSRYNNRDRP